MVLWAAPVVVAVGLAGWALARHWPETRAALTRLSVPTLVAAGLLAVVSALLADVTWQILARGLGADGGRWLLARVFFVGQLGKYLPGPGWPMVLQGGLGSSAQQPVRATAGAGVLCAALAPVVGVPLGLLLVLAGAPGQAGRLAWLALPVLPLLALLHPAVFGRVVDGALRVVRRPPVAVRVPARSVAYAGLSQGVLWLVVGAQTALLIWDSGAAPARVALLGAGAAVLAYCAGMLAVVLPAGLGVREGVLVLALTPSLGAGRAVAVTLSSRVLLVCADLLLAAVALCWRRPLRRRRRAAHRVTPADPAGSGAEIEPAGPPADPAVRASGVTATPRRAA